MTHPGLRKRAFLRAVVSKRFIPQPTPTEASRAAQSSAYPYTFCFDLTLAPPLEQRPCAGASTTKCGNSHTFVFNALVPPLPPRAAAR